MCVNLSTNCFRRYTSSTLTLTNIHFIFYFDASSKGLTYIKIKKKKTGNMPFCEQATNSLMTLQHARYSKSQDLIVRICNKTCYIMWFKLAIVGSVCVAAKIS